MLRLALFLVLACSSTVYGERILILDSSVTYFTQTDTLEVRVSFTRPIVLTQDYFALWAGQPIGQWPPSEGLSIRNNVGGSFSTTLTAQRIDYEPFTIFPIGEAQYDVLDNTIEVTVQAIGLPVEQMDYEIAVMADGWIHTHRGITGIDERIVHTPEPASIVLAVAPLFLLFLKRKRNHGKETRQLHFRSPYPQQKVPR